MKSDQKLQLMEPRLEVVGYCREMHFFTTKNYLGTSMVSLMMKTISSIERAAPSDICFI
jgi:hypothetical protein